MVQKITVVIADDHQGVRQGIKELIERGGRFEVVGEAANGKETIEIVNKKSPDLLILDVIMPRIRGDDVAKTLTKQNPDLKILVVSSFDNPQYILNMFENGVRGYLTKDEAPELLLKAANEIISDGGKVWISEKLKAQAPVKPKPNSAVTLSHTEHRILELLKAGLSRAEIAEEFSFSAERLERYIKIILMKFNVNSVQEMLELR